MTNYKDTKLAFQELNKMMEEENFNEKKAIFKLTLKYEVSQLCIKKRIALINEMRGE